MLFLGGERLKRIAIINILGIYVYSLLWACTPLFGWGEYDVESFGTACSLNWHYDSQRYFITIYAVIVLFPLTFTALCLCSICSHAQVEDEEWDQLKVSEYTVVVLFPLRFIALCLCLCIIYAATLLWSRGGTNSR